MLYKINLKKIFRPIGIPSEVVDYMDEFDETTLKTLILIFSENKVLSEVEISKKLKKPVSEINEALKKLETKKIVSLLFENETSVHEISELTAFQMTHDEIKNCFKDPVLKRLYNEAERLYCRPLNTIERKNLIYIYQAYDLPIEVILMAVKFCIENKKSAYQLKKICENWSNEGILTLEQVEQTEKSLNEQKIENKIKECFGIYGRALSSNEKKYILKWTKIYNFNIDMIKKAFEICVDRIGNRSFSYIEKICKSWFSKKISTLEQVEQAEKILNEQKQIENQIKKHFGIYGRALFPNEKKYILKWLKTYGFDVAMIKKAYDQCFKSTGNRSFIYIDKIMTDWFQNNVRTENSVKDYEFEHITLKKAKKSNKNYWKFHDSDAVAFGLEQNRKRSENLIKEELKRMNLTAAAHLQLTQKQKTQ